MFFWVTQVSIADVFDVAFLTLFLYAVLVWFKRTRAVFVLTGIVIVAGFYALIRQFGLVLTTAVFERFFAVLLIALVVIFQEELRYFFEQVAVWSLNRRLGRKKEAPVSREEVRVLGRTLLDFSKERIGALVVIQGKDLLFRHLHGGTELGGKLSEPLVKSIFNPRSPTHDGAMIVEGNRVTLFAAHLPLSKNTRKLDGLGTRHGAALGLSELTDALCLVVSEQSGRISTARDGDMTFLSAPEELIALLDEYYAETSPKGGYSPVAGFFRKNWREKILALVVALTLWFFLVGSQRMVEAAIPPLPGPGGFESHNAQWRQDQF